MKGSVTKIKVMEDGYDVFDSPDYKATFDSSRPKLNIIATGEYTATSSPQTIYTHRLGYVPAIMVFIKSTTNDRIRFVDGSNSKYFRIDDASLSYGNSGPTGVTYRWYIFSLDIEEDFQAEAFNIGSVNDAGIGSKNTAVIKAVVPGKDVTSRDLRDFTINSQTKSPTVHSVTTGSYSSSPHTVTIEHDLGYAPMALAFEDFSGYTGDHYVPVTGAGDFSIESDETNVVAEFVGSGTNRYSIVVLKDPLKLDG